MTDLLTPPGTLAGLGGGPLGVDTASRDVRDADHDAQAVVRALRGSGALQGALVATHLTRRGGAHVALSVDAPALTPLELRQLLREALPSAVLSGGADAPQPEEGRPAAAAEAAAAHAGGRDGRAVHFPGVEQLTGTLPVGRVLEVSAIERVLLLGSRAEADPGVAVVTREHVRPTFVDGRLVLLVQWAVGGTLMPFENPSPTPCCADHA